MWHARLLSRVQISATLCTLAHQAQLTMDSPGKKTAVDCHVLLQGIFPTQRLNLCFLHCRQILYHCTAWEALIDIKMIKILHIIFFFILTTWNPVCILCLEHI